MIARVVGLFRYPVKSMAAEPLEAADVHWHGLAGDRRWAFVRPGLERSDFPWLTIRERPDMHHFRPSLLDPSRPDDSRTVVRAPGGEELDVADPALAARLGDGVRVIKQNRGVFDTAPLSLLSTGSLAGLGALVGSELDVRRFRPNVLVEPVDDTVFAEDDWVGAVLRIGQARMRVDRRDSRCVMVNVDPETTERDPSILKTLGRERDACFGVYGTTVQPGRVAVGDPVLLEAAAAV
ncbi:MAG TPA: MOSC N-terminal beta barrel domain-containing protein [Solirubrobacteraceae bacterium]|nr:MOSC N-terminal beta barrel domain-containing protein [Solirubrobacteraceae bacterium]